jgi:hypothetical protein
MPTTKIAVLVYLGILTLFAGSALAQEGEAAPSEGTSPQPPRLPLPRQANPLDRTASADAKTQQQMKSEAVGSDHTSTCTYTFTSGSGATYLQFCVTVNGNIVEFQSPLNKEQIRQGTYGEGYGICDLSTETSYYDYADTGDSGNWKAPTTVTHGATMVKIERTTSDGLWTLTQTITSMPGMSPAAKVLMALKNNSSSSKFAYVFRWADVDPGQAAGTDTNYKEDFDGTLDSAWGYLGYGNTYDYGLMIQDVGNPTPTTVGYERAGYALESAPTDACDPFTLVSSPLLNFDGSIMYLWSVSLKKEQSVSVTSRYLSF